MNFFWKRKKYFGVNVENVSYGLTLCAERCAMAQAVSNGEKTPLKAVAIYSPNQKMCVPCGACLQWMSEFRRKDDVQIILENENGEAQTFLLSDFPGSMITEIIVNVINNFRLQSA